MAAPRRPPVHPNEVVTRPAIAAIGGAAAAQLRFTGCAQFRQRITLATLARKRVRIDDIRADSEEPGLQDFEASFLRLVEKLTNGMVLEINETGTSLRYVPGVLQGGVLEHDCGLARGIGWFVEGVLPLLPPLGRTSLPQFSPTSTLQWTWTSSPPLSLRALAVLFPCSSPSLFSRMPPCETSLQ